MIKKDTFDKEKFKKELESNVRMLFRRKLEEATPQQIYQAVAYSVKDDIIDNWIETHKAYEKQDKKMVYYMSMEFLMGRALGNNMINLLCYDDVRETLEELGLDLNLIEDQEPDAALGNGGLGRLAACFLDSLATLGYNTSQIVLARFSCSTAFWYSPLSKESKLKLLIASASQIRSVFTIWLP